MDRLLFRIIEDWLLPVFLTGLLILGIVFMCMMTVLLGSMILQIIRYGAF